MNTLYVRESGGYREANADDVLDCAREVIAQCFRPGAPVLNSPGALREFLQLHLCDREREVFGALHLDGRCRLIQIEELFAGTIDTVFVHPREVVKSALEHNAASLICFHNHPSGDPAPSHADQVITARLSSALALVDIPLRDHLIVGETTFSFAEVGLL